MGRLSGDRLTRLTAAYEKERAEPERTVHELRDAVSAAEQETANVQSFLKEVKKRTEPAELAPLPLLRRNAKLKRLARMCAKCYTDML